MTDPVINALTMKLDYGDEQLRQEVENYIRQLVRSEMYNMTSDHVYFESLMHNNSYKFSQLVLQAVKEQFNNPQTIY